MDVFHDNVIICDVNARSMIVNHNSSNIDVVLNKNSLAMIEATMTSLIVTKDVYFYKSCKVVKQS